MASFGERVVARLLAEALKDSVDIPFKDKAVKSWYRIIPVKKFQSVKA